jgi:hypothetical protein
MSRHQRYQDEAEARYSKLSQFLGCYFHEETKLMYGTADAAVDQAIVDYPIDLLRDVRHELIALLNRTSDDTTLRSMLNFGLGAHLHFKKPADARAFAQHVESKLLAAIQNHYERMRHK